MPLIKMFIGLLSIAVVGLLIAPSHSSAAACEALAQDKGQAAYEVTVATSGSYTLWVRMAMPASDRNSVFIQVDSQCPVTVGDAVENDGLQWANYRDGNPAAPITVDLAAGAHTVILAGREAGVAVDKVLFVGDPKCVPVLFGDNCLADAAKTPANKSGKVAPAQQTTNLHTPLLLVCAVAVSGALAFLIFKYIRFDRRLRESPVQIGNVVVGGEVYTELHLFRRLLYFARHHWLIVGVAWAVIVVSVVVGIVAAARPYPVFEAESGVLSGGAKIVDNTAGSGGKVVQFEVNPSGTGGGSSGSGGSGGGSTGSSSGGSSGSSGGGGGGGTGSCAVSTSHVPDGPDGMGGCWPGASNTGPNASQASMSAYSGSCTISAPNTTIDSKVINCSPLEVGSGASGLVIKNSYIKGGVIQASGSASFTIQDSHLDNAVYYDACTSPSSCSSGYYACGDPNNATIDCGVGYKNFTILRTEIINTNRAAYCESTCTIQDSYFHGTNLWPDHTNLAHASSVRNEQYLTLRHNSLGCDYTGPFPNSELGCSADMSGYPDFAPIKNATIERNLFLANSIGVGYCVYGGGTSGKPFSNDPTNATYIVFRDNIFQRGTNGKCGTYGPVTDFIPGRTGNEWTNNKWSDGATVDPN